MNKKAVVFYFHGYKSSPSTSKKVEILKENFPDTYAFPIDIDPEVSIPYLVDQIEQALLNHVSDGNTKVFFVGTSLGAYYAMIAARYYPKVKLILINPVIDTQDNLIKLGVDPEIASKYPVFMDMERASIIFLSTEDELFHYELDKEWWDTFMPVEWVEADHRFNGPEFNKVISYIKESIK